MEGSIGFSVTTSGMGTMHQPHVTSGRLYKLREPLNSVMRGGASHGRSTDIPAGSTVSLEDTRSTDPLVDVGWHGCVFLPVE